MSKIFKASDINMDPGNKFFVEVQNFADVNFAPANNEDESDFDFGENGVALAEEEKILAKAKAESEKIVKKAVVEASKVLADVKAQCDKLREETKAKAYKKGYDEGYSKGTAEAEAIKAKANSTLEQAESEHKRILEDIEPQMVDLILKIITKLLGDSIELNPQMIMNLIKQGLMESTITGDIIVRVSNDDFEIVSENKSDILSMVGGGTNIEVVKDFTINKSDCIIETPFGNIDCSLDQQFENLKRNIYYIFENR